MKKLTSPIKIAIVDDDNMFLRMASKIVRHNVHENVLSFRSSKAALSHIEENDSADIILSDINMPEMSGLELLTRIKRKYPAKVCIMMSGDPANEKCVRELGADGYLNKPFQASELSDLIHSFI
jgi:DNA-binding NtrC family response regulator